MEFLLKFAKFSQIIVKDSHFDKKSEILEKWTKFSPHFSQYRQAGIIVRKH